MYVYIHGFNSFAQSRSYKDLSRILPQLHDCTYDYTKKAEYGYNQLCLQIQSLIKENSQQSTYSTISHQNKNSTQYTPSKTHHSLKLLGSSLGAFWALHLAEKFELPCLAFNPVTFAHEQLRPFLGTNENFYTKQEWEFTEEILNSYTSFAFTRSRSLKATLIIGENDEILDPKIAYNYWNKYAKCIFTKDMHSILNYEKYLDIIRTL